MRYIPWALLETWKKNEKPEERERRRDHLGKGLICGTFEAAIDGQFHGSTVVRVRKSSKRVREE